MKKRKVIRVLLKAAEGRTVNISGHTTSSIDSEMQKKKGVPVEMEYHPAEGIHLRFLNSMSKKCSSSLIPLQSCEEVFFDPEEDNDARAK